jgi:hypothetical protein
VSDPPEPIIASLLAEGANVADREAEVARMADAFRTPGSKLVVYGDRRLGKTSALERAAETARGVRAMVAVASFATASDASGTAQRILAAAQMPAHPRMGWGGSGSTLTTRQQTLLRVLSAEPDVQVTSGDALRRYRSEPRARRRAPSTPLVQVEHRMRVAPGRYAFDDPFLRRCVQVYGLPDIGIPTPPLLLPTR